MSATAARGRQGVMDQPMLPPAPLPRPQTAPYRQRCRARPDCQANRRRTPSGWAFRRTGPVGGCPVGKPSRANGLCRRRSRRWWSRQEASWQAIEAAVSIRWSRSPIRKQGSTRRGVRSADRKSFELGIHQPPSNSIRLTQKQVRRGMHVQLSTGRDSRGEQAQAHAAWVMPLRRPGVLKKAPFKACGGSLAIAISLTAAAHGFGRRCGGQARTQAPTIGRRRVPVGSRSSRASHPGPGAIGRSLGVHHRVG